jgi:hypothetical protein
MEVEFGIVSLRDEDRIVHISLWSLSFSSPSFHHDRNQHEVVALRCLVVCLARGKPQIPEFIADTRSCRIHVLPTPHDKLRTFETYVDEYLR